MCRTQDGIVVDADEFSVTVAQHIHGGSYPQMYGPREIAGEVRLPPNAALQLSTTPNIEIEYRSSDGHPVNIALGGVVLITTNTEGTYMFHARSATYNAHGSSPKAPEVGAIIVTPRRLFGSVDALVDAMQR